MQNWADILPATSTLTRGEPNAGLSEGTTAMTTVGHAPHARNQGQQAVASAEP